MPNTEDEDVPAAFQALINSHRGLKSHLTCQINTADRVLQQLQARGPSTIVLEQLREALTGVQSRYDLVEDSFRQMQALSPPKHFEPVSYTHLTLPTIYSV